MKKEANKEHEKENPMPIKKTNKIRACKSEQAGIALEIRNFKALKIRIGDVIVPEIYFLKLFPNKFEVMKISKGNL